MSKRTLHTNLVGRTVRIRPDMLLWPVSQARGYTEDETFEIVAAHLSDGEVELLARRHSTGELDRLWSPWILLVPEKEEED